MNFVQHLEECLRDLAAEARKKHPGVKEASERATLRLRSLQVNYVAAVRKASSADRSSSTTQQQHQRTTHHPQQHHHHPTTSMFQSSEILHPFLLAANYPNADYKLLEISFKAMRLLMEADAIVPTDAIHMIRVYQIQAQVITAYFTKYYAKEIAAATAAVEQQEQLNRTRRSISKKDHTSNSIDDEVDDETESGTIQDNPTPAITTSISSSWFSWGSGGTTTSHTQESRTSTTTTEASSSSIIMLKNAVSSSSGQTGHQASVSTYPQMEKLALEILSSLLQLVQLLRNYNATVQPTPLTDEIWTHSIAIACLWCSLLLPANQASSTAAASAVASAAASTSSSSLNSYFQGNTVQQASHSTVHQLTNLLFQTNTIQLVSESNATATTSSSISISHKLLQSTWEDLLSLTASDPRCVGGGGTVKLTGAFKLCQKRPSPELALELMTQVWKETNFVTKNNAATTHCSRKNYEELLVKTMGVTMALLQQISKTYTAVEKSLRTSQWTLALLQSHSQHYPNECCELFAHMVNKEIPAATTACRKNHDFEDGYVYNYYHDPATNTTYHSDESQSTRIGGGGIGSNLMASGGAGQDIGSQDKQRKATIPSQVVLGTCFPIPLLWKAGFVLELVYHVLDKEDLTIDNNNNELALIFILDEEEMERTKHKSILQTLTEALSDFATVGSSCHDHIIQVVEFCYTRSASNFKPKLFRSAEQIISTGNSAFYFSKQTKASSLDSNYKTANIDNEYHHIDNTAAPAKLLSTSITNSKRMMACPILGESIWISFQIILRIGECLFHNRRMIVHPSRLLNKIFPSSLAVLQHFMKRFVACEELIRLTLRGYTTLADLCFFTTKLQRQKQEDEDDESFIIRQRVLLSSLSKLSLPSWGKQDPSCQLQDHHVLSLLCLLRIVHTHYDDIGCEYEAILKTFEELSVLSIASTQLSDEIYHSSLALSAAYSRFARLSTCLSIDSLKHMTVALTNICESVLQERDTVGESDTFLPERIAAPSSTSSQDAPEKNIQSDPGRDSIGGKLMSLGVRAIYGAGTSSGGELETKDEYPRAERTKNVYYQDYRNDFARRISASATLVRIHSFGRVPFCLILLADVAMANIYRQTECGELFAGQFSRLAATTPIIRPFLMDIMTMQIMAQFSPNDSKLSSFTYGGKGKIVFEDPMQSQLLAVEYESEMGGERIQISQVEALRPLCDLIKITDKPGVAQAALGVLSSVLEGTGEKLLGEVWSMIIDSVSSLSGGSPHHSERASAKWATCCLMAFKSLKLIVDDFLDHLPSSASSDNVTTHISLLECCESFVVSRHDINTSLTAIGLLWTIADQDSESSSIERALSKLVVLSSDDRTEVRNAAVNTLFSCIAGRGGSFTAPFWKICIKDAILKVYDIVTEKSRSGQISRNETLTTTRTSRYVVSLHHSRDSAGKQWVVTQVLVLRGLSRVLKNFFSQLLDSAIASQDRADPDLWFQDAWVKILDYAFDAAGQEKGRENMDIRSVGVELLVVCCQLASKAGIHAAITPAKVSTKMEVVNGALRNVRDAQLSKLSRESSYSGYADNFREKLFLEAFESLEYLDEVILRKRPDPDDTDLQVSYKLCSNLASLYACCKDNEFQADKAARSLELFKSFDNDSEQLRENMEGRFVQLILSVLITASTDPKLRYLNQCQRVSVDLLQTMAADGSPSAFNQLILIADLAFFVRRESDESDSTSEGDTASSPSMLSFEAASIVAREISKPGISDECKMLVLFKVTAIFLKVFQMNTSEGQQSNKDLRLRRHYKSFVPVIVNGLQSSARHEELGGLQAISIVDRVWEIFCVCFKGMLSPVPLGKDLLKIPRVQELLQVIPCVVSAVPERHRHSLCSVLSYGAAGSLDVAKQHAVHSKFDAFSDIERKSKRHRDDLLKLFDSCFSGGCTLNPEDSTLRSVALIALKGCDSSDDSRSKVSVEASLLICRVLRENCSMETIIIAAFPVLCNLVVSDDKELKVAVQNLFAEGNVAGILERARIRYENAEKEANDTQKQIEDLVGAIRDLQQEKELLQHQIALLETCSGN